MPHYSKYTYPLHFVGLRYRKLFCITEKKSERDGRRMVYTRCDCGKYTWVAASELISGRAKSCGCQRKEAAGKRFKENNPMWDPKLKAIAIAKMSISQKGKRHTKESKERMSIAQKGKTLSKETRLKIALSHLGKPLSTEHKMKISASHGGCQFKATCSQQICLGTATCNEFVNRVHREHYKSVGNIKIYMGVNGACVRMRSMSEIYLVHILDDNGILWKYENQWFDTPLGRYCSDFYIPSWKAYLEVKAPYWNSSKQLAKISYLRASGINVYLVDSDMIVADFWSGE